MLPVGWVGVLAQLPSVTQAPAALLTWCCRFPGAHGWQLSTSPWKGSTCRAVGT